MNADIRIKQELIQSLYDSHSRPESDVSVGFPASYPVVQNSFPAIGFQYLFQSIVRGILRRASVPVRLLLVIFSRHHLAHSNAIVTWLFSKIYLLYLDATIEINFHCRYEITQCQQMAEIMGGGAVR